MTKQEFLAASLPYGLKHQLTEKGIFNLDMEYPNSRNNCMKIIGTCGEDYDLSDGDWGVGYIDIDEFKPIIRHPDTLTQECIQEDYNDGKPFIPIVELARIAFPQYCIKFEDGRVLVDTDWDIASFNFNGKDFASDFFRVFNQLQLFQHLLKFHFWPNKPEGEEVVYVTETFNPYAP